MIDRALHKKVEEALGTTPVVFLAGPRQAGKSTLAQKLDLPYFTLDDAATRVAASRDPQGFIQQMQDHVVIDEAQRVPDLALALKLAVDQNRTPGRFLLTGSAGSLVLPKFADALVGRMRILTLRPLSVNEIVGTPYRLIPTIFDKRAPTLSGDFGKPVRLERSVIGGGFPEVVNLGNPAEAAGWFEGYLDTVTQREIRDLSAISGLDEIPNILRLIASRTATLANQTDFSRVTSIPLQTLRRYLSLIESVYLLDIIPAWRKSVTKQLALRPKYLLSDTGLACHLLNITRPHDELMWGQLLETFVGNELRKQLDWMGNGYNLYHYRSKSGKEVDFVVEGPDGKIIGIEVKATSSPRAGARDGLDELRSVVGDKWSGGLVLYTGTEIVPFGNGIWIAPVSSLWRCNS